MQVLENIRAILSESGAAMSDIVKVTVYVTDIRVFNDIADIRENISRKTGLPVLSAKFPSGVAGIYDRN